MKNTIFPVFALLSLLLFGCQSANRKDAAALGHNKMKANSLTMPYNKVLTPAGTQIFLAIRLWKIMPSMWRFRPIKNSRR